MIPLHDYRKSKTFPLVNTGILLSTAAVFVYQLLLPEHELEQFILEYSFIASEFNADPLGRIHTLVTTAFLHGGFLHFGGNMLFLFIFGDNVEDALGHLRYALFYIVAAAIAAVAQGALSADPSIPLIGASGAISAVLGGYMILYPATRVLTLIPIGIFLMTARIPAFVFLGVWALLQFISGWQTVAGDLASNVGYIAHVTGFLFGVLFCLVGRRRYLEKFRAHRPALYHGRR